MLCVRPNITQRDIIKWQIPDEGRSNLGSLIEAFAPDAAVQSQPMVFSGCFGWYHPGAGQLGVVLCSPHGYEELCVHRHWRALAQTLSDQDLPTLRFDYAGTGDSADDDETSGRVQAWVESIGNAVRMLRRISGVERVALVGLRMGALLATAAAEDLDDLAALVLLAPIESGDTCFRELRALAKLRAPARHRPASPVDSAGRLEAAGFVYTPQTIADLRALPLVQSGRAPAAEILLLNRPNVVADERFRVRLAACGAAVDEADFDDYPLLMQNPDLSVYPRHGFDLVVDWLVARRGERQQRQPAVTCVTVLRLPMAEEKPLFFGRQPDLFGVLCKPYGSRQKTAVVFLNTGSNHHIGTSRMTVTMARRLAQLGFTSLRLDIGGIGDSDMPRGRSTDTTEHGVRDVCAALDALAEKGYDSFIMIGLCSGAKLALETTLQDDRIVGQVLLNLQAFWKAPDETSRYISRRSYLRMARQLSTWTRAARGGVDVSGIARAFARRSLEAGKHNVREVWGRLRGKDGVRGTGLAQFRRLAARNVRTWFVFVEEDPGLDELEVVFGRSGVSLCRVANISMEIVREGDHIFSWNHSRQQLLSVVEKALLTMTAEQPKQAAE
jgi:pimeloyl-ACP methyl ester carboxylesterase